MTQGKIKHLTFGWYLWPVFLLILLALLDAAYLSVSHYRVYTDMGYQSYCAISKAVNCDTVSQSKYAIMLGVPVPVWGVFGYMVLLALIGTAFFGKGLWFMVFILSLGYSLHSVALALISNYIIKSYCLFCIGSYIANFLICFFSVIILRRFYPRGIRAKIGADMAIIRSHKKRAYVFLVCVLFMASLLILIFPDYWNYSTPQESGVATRGLTDKGAPWIGSENPELVITEYSDYLCFQCRKMHFFLRNLIREYPERIRLIHKNFPMDHRINPLVKSPFHEGAAAMAVLSKYAAGENRFWQINDYFYRHARKKKYLDLEDMARATGLSLEGLKSALDDRGLFQEVFREIREGISLKVQVTPTYLIGEKIYPAQIPPEILKKVLR